MHADDREAFRCFADGAADASDNGWSNLRNDLFTAGAVVFTTALVGAAIVGGVALLNSRRNDARRGNGGQR